VAAATDTTLVVVSPGWGDQVQVAKAGILEIADVFVVNKADREGAQGAVRDLLQMIRMGEPGDWTAPVVATTAATGDGVDDLWEAIRGHEAHLRATGALERGRRARLVREVEGLAAERMRGAVRREIEGDVALAEDLAERRVDPYRAAAILIERVRANR
jgi:LAO/AO transport system kinase